MIQITFKRGDGPDTTRHEVLTREQFRLEYGVIFQAFEKVAENGDVLDLRLGLDHYRVEVLA